MKLAMFDIDGTLTQSVAADGDCFVQALAEVFGFVDVDDDWSQYPDCTDAGIFATIFSRHCQRLPTGVEVAAFQDRFIARLTVVARATPFQPVAGARALLDRLRASTEWTVAVASGAWETSARLKLASAELDTPPLPGAFADESPVRAEIMRRALTRACQVQQRSTFDSIVYIGDGIWDAHASRALGWPFVGIAADSLKAAQLQQAGARAVFANYLQWEAILDALG